MAHTRLLTRLSSLTSLSLGAAMCASLATAVKAQNVPTTPPPAAPVTPAKLPAFQEAVLANGIRVVLVENHRDPVVAFRLALPAGTVYDAKGKEGLAQMAATLLTKGAGRRSADQIAEAIENAGGSLGAGADEDFLSVYGNVLSSSAALAFELLGDVVARPAFASTELELARTQALSGLQLEASQPGAIANRYFTAGLYGEHPYGRRQSATSVRALTRADLVAFQSARLVPQGALLVVAGDITMANVRAMAEKGFGAWKGAPAASPTLPSPPARTKTEIVLVHRPGSVQSNVLVGNLTTGPVDPMRFPLMLANRIIGGNADARLFMVLREAKGWTYGAYSRVTRPRGIGRFEANAEVRTEVTDSALVELLAQLKKLGTEAIPAKELETSKNALVGSFPLSIETSQQLAERVATVKLYGLPSDYLQTYRTKMSAVPMAQVQQAARTLIRPEQSLVLVVGDGGKIHDKLAAIAPVTILSVDGDKMAPSDLAPKTTALPLDLTRLEARRDSFVVLVQGNPLGMSVVSIEKSATGWTVKENTNLAGGMVTQTTTLEADASLNARSLVQGGSTQGQALKTDIAFAGGRAKGTAMTASQTGPKTTAVDAEIPPGTLDSDVIQFALPLLRWVADSKYTVNAFSAGKGTVTPVTFTVVGSESVKVPLGTFDTWKVEQKGSDGTVMLYFTKDIAHRLVRIAPAGQPVELVLAK